VEKQRVLFFIFLNYDRPPSWICCT